MCTEFSGDPESYNFFAQFQKVFHDAGWTVLLCDKKLTDAIARSGQYRGILVGDAQRPMGYVGQEIQGRLVGMGFDVYGFYSPDPLPNLTGVALVVGYKVGYSPPPNLY